jgi:dimethylhistidine N-methyltransferase
VNARGDFERSVVEGLCASPKFLPCRFFYDAEGSRLFEEICNLPEYYLTRAERAILVERAGDIVARTPPGAALVELGSGSAAKTRLLIEALLARDGEARFVPVDISEAMLRESSEVLHADYPSLEILAVCAEYEEGLRRVREAVRGPKLVVWLGSNVGNFERAAAAEFLGRLRGSMKPEDRLLLGVDLRKDREVLEAAYDDARGVTARFNKNLLARINRELRGRFDLESFRHCARYLEEEGRIEMHLVSERAQKVEIAAAGIVVPFERGEAIHTEDSYKYSLEEIDALARRAGFGVEERWLDPEGLFSLTLLLPAGPG